MAALRRMFRLALENELLELSDLPSHFPMVKEPKKNLNAIFIKDELVPAPVKDADRAAALGLHPVLPHRNARSRDAPTQVAARRHDQADDHPPRRDHQDRRTADGVRAQRLQAEAG